MPNLPPARQGVRAGLGPTSPGPRTKDRLWPTRFPEVNSHSQFSRGPLPGKTDSCGKARRPAGPHWRLPFCPGRSSDCGSKMSARHCVAMGCSERMQGGVCDGSQFGISRRGSARFRLSRGQNVAFGYNLVTLFEQVPLAEWVAASGVKMRSFAQFL